MKKVSLLCQWMRIILLLLMIASPIAIIISWLAGTHSGMTVPLRLVPQLAEYPNYTQHAKMLGLLVSLIPAAFSMALLYSFSVVFHQFSHGEIFCGRSIAAFRWASALIIIWELIQPAYDILVGAALTPTHIISSKFIEFDISNLRGLIIGVVLFVMAWALAEAKHLKSEHDLTI